MKICEKDGLVQSVLLSFCDLDILDSISFVGLPVSLSSHLLSTLSRVMCLLCIPENENLRIEMEESMARLLGKNE